MPRSRRRHHSKSRSTSPSEERDKEPKRRRLESDDQFKRSVSPSEDTVEDGKPCEPEQEEDITVTDDNVKSTPLVNKNNPEESSEVNETVDDVENNDIIQKPPCNQKEETMIVSDSDDDEGSNKSDHSTSLNTSSILDPDASNTSLSLDKASKIKITPQKLCSPKQLQKKLDSEKKKEQRLKERQEKEQKRLQEIAEKKRLKQEKIEQRQREKEEKEKQRLREKEEKEQLKVKEKEEREKQRIKEREEKELLKKKEKEDKEEQKKKEKELKEQKRLQEIEEKNKEKLEKEKLKEKEAARFVNFFVVGKKPATESKKAVDSTCSNFMPFEVKSDMRLAPRCRLALSDARKENLSALITDQDKSANYLRELKSGKLTGKSGKTWPVEEDLIVIDDNPVGVYVEENATSTKMRAKLIQFHDNRRPAYFGTWRKKSPKIKPRNPFAQDSIHLDYDVESDEEWESEEENGESIKGSDEDEKENESGDEADEDDFIVPHGYLSDEELANDDPTSFSPEAQKLRLKLLQNEFDEEMKQTTRKMKPLLIGCFWEGDDEKTDPALKEYMIARQILVNGPITIKSPPFNTLNPTSITPKRTSSKKSIFPDEVIPDYMRLIHGNTKNQGVIINEFLKFLETEKNININKSTLHLKLKELATWSRCSVKGPLFNKFCWFIPENVRSKYNVDLPLPNSWKYL